MLRSICIFEQYLEYASFTFDNCLPFGWKMYKEIYLKVLVDTHI